MTKKLDERAMTNELSGSAFFKAPDDAQVDSKVAGNQATQTETKQPSNRDTMQPGNHDTTEGNGEEELLDTVRLSLKELGREAGTHRYTATEKQALEELVFEYRRKGIRTSGNEIIRIGLNYLLEDYHLHKNDSILARVLERLNA